MGQLVWESRKVFVTFRFARRYFRSKMKRNTCFLLYFAYLFVTLPSNNGEDSNGQVAGHIQGD